METLQAPTTETLKALAWDHFSSSELGPFNSTDMEFVEALVAKLRAYDEADLKAALTEFGYDTTELRAASVIQLLAGRLVRIVREAIGVSPRFSRPGHIVPGRVFLGFMPRDFTALPLTPREAVISNMPALQIVELWGRQDGRGRPLMVSAIHVMNGAEHERYLATGTDTDDPHLTEAQRRLRCHLMHRA